MQTLHKYTGASPVLHWDTGALPSIGNKKIPPLAVQGLEFWFSASSPVLSGTDVTGLTDKSINNVQITDVLGTPVYTASNANFNNRPSINNNSAVSQGFDINNFDKTNVNGGWTFFFVIKRSTTGTRTLFDSQSPRFTLYNYHTTSPRYSLFDGILQHFGTSAPDTDTHVVAFVLNSDSNVSQVYEDNVLIGTGTYTSKNIGGETSLLTRPSILGGSVSFGGDWSDMLLYNRPLALGEHSSISQYFMGLYNIT